jgi:AraC-like DNA-binding protein
VPNPKIDISFDKLDALAQFKITIEFAADYLGVSRDTLLRRINEKYGMTFSEYCSLRRQRTATKLQQKAIEQAIRGNTALMIFCLKNMAGWADKMEQDVNHNGNAITLNYNLEKLTGKEAKAELSELNSKEESK